MKKKKKRIWQSICKKKKLVSWKGDSIFLFVNNLETRKIYIRLNDFFFSSHLLKRLICVCVCVGGAIRSYLIQKD